MRRLRATVAVLAATGAAALVPATSASAAASCPRDEQLGYDLRFQLGLLQIHTEQLLKAPSGPQLQTFVAQGGASANGLTGALVRYLQSPSCR